MVNEIVFSDNNGYVETITKSNGIVTLVTCRKKDCINLYRIEWIVNGNYNHTVAYTEYDATRIYNHRSQLFSKKEEEK